MASLPKENYLGQYFSNDVTRQRSETISENIDLAPLSRIPQENIPGQGQRKNESLSLRVSDEERVGSAIYEASKKKKTGSIYSLEIQLPSNGTLGLGVKALKNNMLVISMLKRVNGKLGPGESAGVALGDIVVGVNFRPCRDGVRSLLNALNSESDSKERTISLQCWRCHQLCLQPLPGSKFPRYDDVLVQGYTLFRTKVLSDWERWNFVDIMLKHMSEELECRKNSGVSSSGNPQIRAIHNQVLDLERNILQAKGLRTALCVRIVHTSFVEDAVVYVLRVEDIESGLQWSVRKRYRDFFGLHGDLQRLSHFTRDIPFPKKRLVSLKNSRVIEERIVALEQFIRMCIHRLTHYSPMDAHASQSLRRTQLFLDVGEYVDSLNPPPLDDQRYLELMVYRHLNDPNSVPSQQCTRFVDSINLDSLVTTGNEGYLPVLECLREALLQVEEHILQQFGQQMTQVLGDRRPDLDAEKIRVFVRRCVRRQVESAIYLPLRRAVFRIVYSFTAVRAQKLQQAIRVLKTAPTSIFFPDLDVENAEKLPIAIQAFRDLVSAYLPADQNHVLMKVAGTVMELHSECVQKAKLAKATAAAAASTSTSSSLLPAPPPTAASSTPPAPPIQSPPLLRSDSLEIEEMTNMLNKSVLADPAGTIFSTTEHVLTEKRNFDDDLIVSHDEDANSSNHSKLFFAEKNAMKYSGIDVRNTKSMTPPRQVQSISDKESLLLEGLLRSTDQRTVSVDQHHHRPPITIRGTQLGSRHLSLDSTLLDQRNTLNLEALKSSLSESQFSNEEADLYPLNELENSSPTEAAEIPEDEDDRIDRSGITDDVDESEDEFPIRGTIISPEEEDQQQQQQTTEAPINTQNITIVGADDFLPMFVYVLVRADLPQLILVKDIMETLVDNEEIHGEAGYYMATLDAALHYITRFADDYNASLAKTVATAPAANDSQAIVNEV